MLVCGMKIMQDRMKVDTWSKWGKMWSEVAKLEEQIVSTAGHKS